MYRHFETREALIGHLAAICMDETEAALKSTDHLTGRAAIEAIFEVLMPLADRYHFLINLWHLAEHDKKVTQIDDLHVLIDLAKENGEINRQLPTRWVAAFFEIMLTTAWRLVQAGEVSSKDATKYAKLSFFSGCAT